MSIDTTAAPQVLEQDDEAIVVVETAGLPLETEELLVEEVSIDGMCGVY